MNHCQICGRDTFLIQCSRCQRYTCEFCITLISQRVWDRRRECLFCGTKFKNFFKKRSREKIKCLNLACKACYPPTKEDVEKRETPGVMSEDFIIVESIGHTNDWRNVEGSYQMVEIDNTQKIKIGVCGLDGAGKTTMLHRLKTDHWVPDSQSTRGMNIETLITDNVLFTAWDIPGQLLQHRKAISYMYINNSVGLIYVIDASDPARFSEAHRNLWTMFRTILSQRLPLAIFVNKMDILRGKQVVFSSIDLDNYMEITKMGRLVKIFTTSAKTGEGISEGINWLVDIIMREQ
jgi:ADP-ribosylation factor-like protein 1